MYISNTHTQDSIEINGLAPHLELCYSEFFRIDSLFLHFAQLIYQNLFMIESIIKLLSKKLNGLTVTFPKGNDGQCYQNNGQIQSKLTFKLHHLSWNNRLSFFKGKKLLRLYTYIFDKTNRFKQSNIRLNDIVNLKVSLQQWIEVPCRKSLVVLFQRSSLNCFEKFCVRK